MVLVQQPWSSAPVAGIGGACKQTWRTPGRYLFFYLSVLRRLLLSRERCKYHAYKQAGNAFVSLLNNSFSFIATSAEEMKPKEPLV